MIRYPKGFTTELGQTRIAVAFPPQLFAEIIAMAKREKPPKDFSAMVVYLVKCGKLCLDESDALEPEEAA